MKKNIFKKGFLAISGAIASASAFAVDHTAAITAAQTDATTNVTAAALAVISVAAVLFGVYLVIKIVNK